MHVLIEQVETWHIVHANYTDIYFFVEDDFLVKLQELRVKLAKELPFLESMSDDSNVVGDGVSNFFGCVLLDVKEHQ